MTQTRMEFAYSQLLDKVWSGDLRPGDRLVNRTLGKELGVSTVTVREAIHRLASDGVVEHIPNAGAYVRNLDAKEMVDLFSFRAWLDIFAVREAVRKIEPHELRCLEEVNADMRKILVQLRRKPGQVLCGEMMNEWIQADSKYHRVLCGAAHNTWLAKAVRDGALLTRVMRTKEASSTFREVSSTYRVHVELVVALKKRDLDRAVYWGQAHGDQAIATMLRHLDVSGSEVPGQHVVGPGRQGADT